MKRNARDTRKTRETDLSLEIEFPSSKTPSVDTGVPFFDHMLSSLARHGRIGMTLAGKGDTHIDDHHTVEDVGILFGTLLTRALGDKAGIRRFGDATVPMDDALTTVAVDLSGRAFFRYEGMELFGTIKKYSEELTMEFLRAFSSGAAINLHVKVHHGENRHHVHESIFKALGLALFKAYSIDASLDGEIPSEKGMLA